MISSSGRNVRSASSIAWIGSPSPISPRRVEPGGAHRRRGSRRAARCAAARASSSSETQCRSGELSAGQTTSTSRPSAPPSGRGSRRGARGRRPSRSRRRGCGARPAGSSAGACCTGASGSRRRKTAHSATPVRTRKTASPTHVLITEPITIRREVADRQQNEPERISFAPDRVPHGARGGRR